MQSYKKYLSDLLTSYCVQIKSVLAPSITIIFYFYFMFWGGRHSLYISGLEQFMTYIIFIMSF